MAPIGGKHDLAPITPQDSSQPQRDPPRGGFPRQIWSCSEHHRYLETPQPGCRRHRPRMLCRFIRGGLSRGGLRLGRGRRIHWGPTERSLYLCRAAARGAPIDVGHGRGEIRCAWASQSPCRKVELMLGLPPPYPDKGAWPSEHRRQVVLALLRVDTKHVHADVTEAKVMNFPGFFCTAKREAVSSMRLKSRPSSNPSHLMSPCALTNNGGGRGSMSFSGRPRPRRKSVPAQDSVEGSPSACGGYLFCCGLMCSRNTVSRFASTAATRALLCRCS